ncbi:MAG TPA: LamG-like jellyroll fold domain-containing protein [Puia sp.]|nr:LamG-like jellyroll fold domain-containing protein [Puia sp.]
MPLRSLLLSLLALLVSTCAMAQRFVHPSIPFTKYDLDQLRANITKTPWSTGYSALASDARSKLTYTMEGPFTEVGRAPNLNNAQWISDMTAIHNLTFMYVFTGDSAYARKATNMLDAWAVTNTVWSGNEAMLDIGDMAPYFVPAADILRGTFPGWTDLNTLHVKNYFANVLWPQSWVPNPLRDNNKGALQMDIALSVAAFLDDQDKWNQAVEVYRLDAGAALRCSLPNGEVGDAGRDDHWFVQDFALMWAAEVAWKQGVDLYSEYNDRLLSIGELYNKYAFVGDTMTFTPFGGYANYWTNWGIAPGARHQHPFNDIVSAAYELRRGIPTPYTDQMRAAVGEGSWSFLYLKSSDTSTATPLPPIVFPTSQPVSQLSNVDIGHPGIAGSATYSGGKWIITGAGTAVTNAVNFTFKQISGDFSIIARIDSNSIPSATAGLMMRDGLSPTANSIAVNLYNGSVNTKWNGSVNGYTHYPPKAPWWLKLERIGNRIFSYHSADGVNWTNHNLIYTTFAPNVYVGLFTLSNNTSALNTTILSNVSITNSTPAGAPQITSGLSATATIGAAFNYPIAASNTPTVYKATGLPSGLTIDTSTGVISGTPAVLGTTAVTISASNANGTGSAVLMITVDNNAAPAAPAGLTASVVNGNQIRLSWSDPDSSSLSSYTVQRSLTQGGPYTTIQTGITGSSFVDANPAFEVNNYYIVTALSGSLESGISNEVYANVPPATPSKPVVVNKNNEIDLQWDTAAGAIAYKVKRATVSGGPYTVIAQTNSTSYADGSVVNGSGYYYVISAMGHTLESGNSVESFGVPGSHSSTWGANPASGNWSSASSWVEAAVPASPAILTFRTTTDSTMTNDIPGLQISRLLFDTTANAYTISGDTVSLKTDVVNNSANTQTITTPITIDSQVNVIGASGIDINGTISGTGSLMKTGAGVLQLSGNNTYSGNTIVNGSIAMASIGTGTSGVPASGPLGTGKIIMNGGTILSGNEPSAIYNDIVVNAGMKSFLTQWDSAIAIYGHITGSGTLWEDGNNYPGVDLYGDNSGFTGTFVAALRSGRNRVRFMVPESGSANAYWNLDANGIDCIGVLFKTGTLNFGALSGRGYFRNDGGGTPTLSIGALNLSTTFGGTLNNYFDVVKVGTGTLTFTGNHTYGGTTTVTNGTFLLMNNPATGTFVSAVIVKGGAFGGSGRTTAPVTIGTGLGTGASLAPGNNGIGAFTTTAALTLYQDATYNVELSLQNDTADKISAGSVTLNNPILSVKGIDSGALATGAKLVIIANSGSNPVTGTFKDLPELALVTVNGYNFRITYKGGDGNDVVLMDDRTLPVTISSKPADTALLGRSYSYTITAIKSPTRFNATGLPAGLTVDTATGVISGIPTTTGSYPVTLTAANDTSSATMTLALVIRNTVVDSVSAITGTGKNTIEWNQVTDLGYKVKRGTAATGPFTTLATTNATFYIDSAITTGMTYYYVVAAYDSTGEFGNSTAVTPVAATGAYSYWDFNDSSSTSATDLWGNRPAVLNTGVTRAPGAIKQGLKFDGSSHAYASLPAAAVSTLSDFTISGWVKLDAATSWQRIFDFGTGANVYMFLARNNTNSLRYAITTGGGSKEQGINSNIQIGTGVWVHFAVTWSGNVGILYMNGQEVGRNTSMTLKPSSLGTTTQNWFGRSQYSADPYLNGTLDDIRIYNRQLSPAEIVTLVNAAAPSQPSGLTVASAGSRNIRITWTGSTGAAGYNIKRSTTSGSSYTTIASGITDSSFTDTTLANGGPYYYVVTARSGLFESAPSNEVSVTLAPAAVTYPIATSWNHRVDLSWVGVAGATGYIIKRTSGADTSTIATVTGVTYSDTSVTNGTVYTYVIYATNTVGASAAGPAATATPISQPVMNAWSHADIGAAALTGNAGYANGITAYGNGADVWGNADAFHFVYQTLSGNGAIVAHVDSLQNYATTTVVSGNAKAGVMIRDALTAGARHGMVDVTPAVGVEFIRRTSTNGSSSATSAAGITAPYWVKLIRSKDTLRAYRSADGISWTTIASQTYTGLAANVYIGLVVCSHNTAAISRGVFDTVSMATAVPAMTNAKTATAFSDSSFNFQLTATNSAYRFSATGLPDGLSINTATGIISGTPSVVGSFPAIITATNALGAALDTLTITAVDNTPPVVTAPKTQLFCYSATGAYTLPTLTATDNFGVDSVTYVISGATSRSGTGSDAGGSFNVGRSTILWTVVDVHGNATTALTDVTVDAPLTAAIPDVYAMDSAVDEKNTIYLGYGPTSLTITTTAWGGASPYGYLWNTGAATGSITVGAAGTYSATVMDSAGCTATDSILIKMVDVSCGNNDDKVTICHNGNTICVSPDAVPAHLSHGDHLGVCTATSCQVTTAAGSGGNGKALGDPSSITVYPNPVGESFTIQLGSIDPRAIMQLYTPTGILVRMDRLVNSTTRISVRSLAAGLYYLTIKNGQTIITQKIIKL